MKAALKPPVAEGGFEIVRVADRGGVRGRGAAFVAATQVLRRRSQGEIESKAYIDTSK